MRHTSYGHGHDTFIERIQWFYDTVYSLYLCETLKIVITRPQTVNKENIYLLLKTQQR